MIKNVLNKLKYIVLDSVDLAKIVFYELQARHYELKKKRAYVKWLKGLLDTNEIEIYECFSKLTNE